MKKMKSIFFMLLIAMSMMCTVVHAEPTAAPAAEAPAATAEAVPTEAPTPEATVAPELSDNQIDAKSGVTEVIFKVRHTDTIDISIISPSDTVLNTSSANVKTESVAGGTIVTVSEPEAGIWTINATSTVGEAVTVESECEYNFVVELTCENVIYNGVSSKFIAFVKSKDGTNIDPNVLRTSVMKLNILEEGQERPRTVDMTFKGAAYEASYTYNDVGRLSVWAVAEITDTGAEVESDKTDIISILDPNASSGFPIWAILLIVVVVTGLGVFLYIKFSDKMKTSKGSKNMTGTVTINIAVNGVEKLPINRNLAMLGMSVGMLNIIGDDEYYDVDGITISGGDKGLKIVNKSRCEVRYSNAGADPNGVTLLDGQYFKIFMPDEKTVITVTYHSEDIFSSLLNTAASEQQKQMEEKIAAASIIEQAVTAEDLYKEFDKPAEATTATEEAPTETEAQTEAPALESLNLSEATEDAVPEVQPEEEESPAETTSFTIDTSDAEEIAPAVEEEYSFDTAPALEGFSFSGLTEEAAELAEETAQQAESLVEETAEAAEDLIDNVAEETSFTIDTSDSEETTAPVREVIEDSNEALSEHFANLASMAQEVAEESTEAVEEAYAPVREVIEDSNEALSEHFASLASLAQEAADTAETKAEEAVEEAYAPVREVIEDSNEALSEHFANLASMAQEVAEESTEAVEEASAPVREVIEDSNEALSEHFASLASLAQEAADEADEADETTTSLFGDLASLAADVADEAETAVPEKKEIIEDSNEALSDYFSNLQNLADELTKE